MPSFATLEPVAQTHNRAPQRRRGRAQPERVFRSHLDPTPLASALARTGVRPFTDESVAEYKKEVVAGSVRRFDRTTKRIHHSKFMGHYAQRAFSDGEIWIVPILGVFVTLATATASWILGSAIGLITVGSFVSWGEAYLWNFGLGFAFVFGTLLAYRLRPGFIRRMTEAWHRRIANHNARYKWTDTALPQFDRPVPAAVTRLIGRLREECPAGTTFTVDHVDVDAVPDTMVIDAQARALADDPFLWVGYGNERYPVAVWDQHGFRIVYQ